MIVLKKKKRKKERKKERKRANKEEILSGHAQRKYNL